MWTPKMKEATIQAMIIAFPRLAKCLANTIAERSPSIAALTSAIVAGRNGLRLSLINQGKHECESALSVVMLTLQAGGIDLVMARMRMCGILFVMFALVILKNMKSRILINT